MGLTQRALQENYLYEPETGLFRHRFTRGRKTAMAVAGAKDAQGRINIGVNGKLYKAHRLAWLYVHGRWPNQCIDHINGNATDNRIENLREVTHAQNMQNLRKARSDSTSGLMGAMPLKRGTVKKWIAEIRVNGRKKYLGRFATAETAHVAFVNAKRELHPFWSL